MKKFIIAIVSFLMMALSFSASAQSFTDVNDLTPYITGIEFIKSQGIVGGYPDGSYKPKNPINRAELLKIIVAARYSAKDFAAYKSKSCFPDVPASQWFTEYICFAKAKGIVGGYPDGTFKPAQTINFVESAKILMNSFEYSYAAGGSPWYRNLVNKASEMNFIPLDVTSFDLKITRAQMADMISRVLKYRAGKLNEYLGEDKDFFQTYDDIAEGVNNSIYITQKAEDCFPQEKYDPVEQICYYECDSDAQCAAIEKQIQAYADSIGDDYYEGDKDYTGADVAVAQSDALEDGTGLLISYSVSGNSISNPVKEKVKTEHKKFQDDAAKHKEVWNMFTSMIPEQERNMITRYQVFTDGPGGTLAAVTPDESNPEKWYFLVDIQDTANKQDLTYTLIHEFGHLLTLKKTQVPPVVPPHTESEAAALAYEKKKRAECLPQFWTGEGCSLPKSYINVFFQSYWKDIYPDILKIAEAASEEKAQQLADAFYSKYQARFVTDYAATNPGEDIAEAWTAFVLKEKPTGSSVADQKVRFFYNYPDLIRLRTHIRSNLK